MVFRQLYDRELSGAVYCNDLQMKYFNLLHSSRRLQMTKDRLFLMSIVIYFNRFSALQPIFDEELLLYTDYGLIQFWKRQFIDERSLGNNYDQQLPKKLKMINVIAIFQICTGLLVFCLFVFALEQMAKRIACVKVLIERVTY